MMIEIHCRFFASRNWIYNWIRWRDIWGRFKMMLIIHVSGQINNPSMFLSWFNSCCQFGERSDCQFESSWIVVSQPKRASHNRQKCRKFPIRSVRWVSTRKSAGPLAASGASGNPWLHPPAPTSTAPLRHPLPHPRGILYRTPAASSAAPLRLSHDLFMTHLRHLLPEQTR